jgi:hypothetical protein
MYTAYLIDPAARSITTIQTAGTLKHLYALIGCTSIDAVELDEVSADTLYIDDEGFLADTITHYFATSGFAQPFAGKGVVIGTMADGDTTNVAMSLDRLTRNIVFLEMRTGILASAYKPGHATSYATVRLDDDHIIPPFFAD